ncbi:MAG: MATE family efflux transporter, partial [Planctomycetota bacterium]
FVGYLRIVAIGVPMSSVLFSGIACLRGAGDSLRPLWAMAACNLVNIVVSVVLVGVPIRTSELIDGQTVTTTVLPALIDNGFGIYGIAVGTIAAHTVGAIIITVMLVLGRGGVKLMRRRLVPHWVTIRRLVRLGLPNFLESLGMWLGNFVVVMFVGWLTVAARIAGNGEGLFGAHIWAIRIEAFSFLPGFAMGMAAATIAGQYLGAGSADLARAAIVRCIGIGAGVMTLMGVGFIVFPDEIIGLFTAQEAHLRLVPPLLVICGWVQLPFAVALVVRSALRGTGDVTVVMWITWITTYAVRLPLAYAISGVDIRMGGGVVIENPFPFNGGLNGLWIGLCAELAIRGVVFGARFAQGGWAKIRV